MTGSMAEKRSDAVCGDGLMGLLQKLDHSEILEVLSGGFCKNCEAVLEDRVRALMNSKRPSSSLSHLFSRVRLDSFFFLSGCMFSPVDYYCFSSRFCLVACFPLFFLRFPGNRTGHGENLFMHDPVELGFKGRV